MFSAGRPCQLLLATAAVSAAAYSVTALGPLQEAIRASMAFSDNQMAMLQGVSRALPLILGAVPLGLLTDRYSRVRLLLLFAILDVLADVGTAASCNFAWLFTFRCLVGLVWSATLVLTISLVADLFEPAARGRATMVMGIGQVAGSSIAFALGGALLGVFGRDPHAWQLSMIWLGAPLCLAIFSVLLMREPPRARPITAASPIPKAFIELWKYRTMVVPMLGGLMVVDVAFGAAYIWAAPVFSRKFALAPDRVGAIMAMVLLLSGFVGPLTGGFLADSCQRAGGPHRSIVILCGLAALSAPLGLFALASGFGLASVCLTGFLTLVPAISLMTTTLCTIVIPGALHGLSIALLNAASVLCGYVIAPIAVSMLSHTAGGPTHIGDAVAIVCITASALGASIFALGARSFPEGRDCK